MVIDYRSAEGYNSRLVLEDYSRCFHLDLEHHIRNACYTLLCRRKLGSLTEEGFQDDIAMAFGAIDRFLEAEDLYGFPTPELLKRIKDIYRYALEQFEGMNFPDDVERARGLLSFLGNIIPRPM